MTIRIGITNKKVIRKRHSRYCCCDGRHDVTAKEAKEKLDVPLEINSSQRKMPIAYTYIIHKHGRDSVPPVTFPCLFQKNVDEWCTIRSRVGVKNRTRQLLLIPVHLPPECIHNHRLEMNKKILFGLDGTVGPFAMRR